MEQVGRIVSRKQQKTDEFKVWRLDLKVERERERERVAV